MGIYENLERFIPVIVNENFRFSSLAKITKIHPNHYQCDCIAINMQGEELSQKYINVPIPKMIGIQQGGIFALPSKGSVVLIHFINGEIHSPVISSIIDNHHHEKLSENTLLFQQNKSSIFLRNNIDIKAGGTNTINIKNDILSLSSILKEIVDNICQLQMLDPISGTLPINPLLLPKLQLLNQKIDQLLGE